MRRRASHGVRSRNDMSKSLGKCAYRREAVDMEDGIEIDYVGDDKNEDDHSHRRHRRGRRTSPLHARKYEQSDYSIDSELSWRSSEHS